MAAFGVVILIIFLRIVNLIFLKNVINVMVGILVTYAIKTNFSNYQMKILKLKLNLLIKTQNLKIKRLKGNNNEIKNDKVSSSLIGVSDNLKSFNVDSILPTFTFKLLNNKLC